MNKVEQKSLRSEMVYYMTYTSASVKYALVCVSELFHSKYPHSETERRSRERTKICHNQFVHVNERGVCACVCMCVGEYNAVHLFYCEWTRTTNHSVQNTSAPKPNIFDYPFIRWFHPSVLILLFFSMLLVLFLFILRQRKRTALFSWEKPELENDIK